MKPFRQLSLSSTIEMALYKHQTERALMEREAWLTTVHSSRWPIQPLSQT